MTMADVIHAAALVDFCVAVYGNVDDTPVNDEERLNLCWRWFVNLTRRQQIPFTVMEPQVRLTFLMLEQFTLAISALIRHRFSTTQHPNRNRLRLLPVGNNTTVVGNGAMLVEHALGFLVQFVTVRHLTKTTHDHLCSQPELFSNAVIQSLLQRVFAKHLTVPSVFTDSVASSIRSFKRYLERIGLLWRMNEFDLSCQFHILILSRRTHKVNQLRKERAPFFPTPKGGDS